MSRQIAKRARLVRVREVQHLQAVVETSRARDEAANIEDNAKRLASVREELFALHGQIHGGALAAQRELAERLHQAGRQLDGALYDANRRVAQKEQAAVAADREREIAERLKEKAHRAAQDRFEARLAALPHHKRTKG